MANLTHKLLIDFLSNYEPYQNIKIVDRERNTSDLKDLDINEINKAVFLIGDFFNQPTGSSGDINLYKLLQVYFKDLKKRKLINNILEG
jgi:hypothetical protein